MLFVAAGVVAACVTTFVLIAEDLVDGGGLISHDQTVLRWFVDHRTDGMISVARLVSTVGGFVSLLCLSVFLAAWLWRRGWELAVAPLTSLLFAGLAAAVAKSIFGRARPPIALHGVRVTSPAFPSGHAADAAAFFLAAAFVLALTEARSRRTQLALIAAAILFAALVGISRLVLAVHWLSDVVAGWALGTAIATAAVATLWFASTHRNPNLRMQVSHPTTP
jgi:undecaprenyl-diphosphatase